MIYLAINDSKIIQPENIHLTEEDNFFRIKYKIFNSIFMNTLCFKLKSVSIMYKDNFYYIDIGDINDKKQVSMVDHFFNENINFYKSFIKNDKILFYKNHYLDNFYNLNKDKLTDIFIIIKYIKKGKDNYPIIHINHNESR